MVGAAIGSVLGNAVGVAISPVPMIALILMLFSQAAARNGLAFLAGWLLGLTGVAVVVLAIELEGSSDGGSTAAGVVKIVIGLLFLGLGWRQWQGRPEPGSQPEVPGWMAAVDELSAIRALGLGLLLTVANPKNLGLTIAAAASISGAGLSGGEEAVVVAVFVLLASLTILVPVVAYLSARERAEPMLSRLKDWLMANNATVMTVLFAVLGAKVLGDGLSLLS